MKFNKTYAKVVHEYTILEQGHKDIIANMLCLGIYLGLFWYIDME